MYQFNPILKRAIKKAEKRGLIVPEQREQILAGLTKKGRVGKKIRTEVERQVLETVQATGFVVPKLTNKKGVEAIDWSQLSQWLVDNMDTIVKIILAVIAMF